MFEENIMVRVCLQIGITYLLPQHGLPDTKSRNKRHWLLLPFSENYRRTTRCYGLPIHMICGCNLPNFNLSTQAILFFEQSATSHNNISEFSYYTLLFPPILKISLLNFHCKINLSITSYTVTSQQKPKLKKWSTKKSFKLKNVPTTKKVPTTKMTQWTTN